MTGSGGAEQSAIQFLSLVRVGDYQQQILILTLTQPLMKSLYIQDQKHLH